ncbi:hypothetical protein BS50DRAFT_643411 [Corynespora cassiicola Philippines]|uniref:Lumazine-binding protein n=1 Tax=Corynespora cassiicola Philippines TaxID=1448308 RepID=A0A2T2PB82_CORCC|nr:hypothetical protein BS50DRAFT_643411 [Corynespora cassiicola Philippines]
MVTTNTKTISTSEYDDVIKTVNKYVEGLRVGSVEIASSAFHDDATMYGYVSMGGDMLAGPISNLWDYMKEHGSAPEIKTRLDVIAMTPTTAVVRVEMEQDASGADYTDFHTLIKIENHWQIIAKVFHKYND